MAQSYRRTRTKHREDKKGRGWTKLERMEVDFGPPFFKFTVMSVYTCIKLSLTQRKIILSRYVAMILQMKDSWSANLTFRAHTEQN